MSACSAAVLFPHQATGSLIEREGALVGAALVGQSFVDPGRIPVDPIAASGSGIDPHISQEVLPEKGQGPLDQRLRRALHQC